MLFLVVHSDSHVTQTPPTSSTPSRKILSRKKRQSLRSHTQNATKISDSASPTVETDKESGGTVENLGGAIENVGGVTSETLTDQHESQPEPQSEAHPSKPLSSDGGAPTLPQSFILGEGGLVVTVMNALI